MSDIIRRIQELYATCTSPEGTFVCMFTVVPLVIALGFVITFASVVLTFLATLARPFIGELNSKTCPQCGETVRRKAAICRFCRYVFPDVPPPP